MSPNSSARLLWLAALLALPFSTAGATNGVTDNEIILGMSVPLSGPNGLHGIEMKEGAEIYLRSVNESGGMNGRKLRLIVLDDAQNAQRAAANTKKLIEENKVFALLAYYGTESTEAVLPLLESGGVPLIGTTSGADSLRYPPHRYLFNLRASYQEEAEAIVTQLDSQALRDIAVVYQNDSFGKSGLTGTRFAMARLALRPTALSSVERNSTDMAKSASAIVQSNPKAVVIIAGYQVAAELIKQVHRSGAHPQFVTMSTVGADILHKELGADSRGIGSAQVMPFPWSTTLPLVKQYQALTKQYSKQTVSYSGLEGFVAARLTVEGLKKAGKNPTREKFVSALEDEYELGGYRLRYTPNSRSGSRFTDMTVIGKDGRIVR